MTHLEMQKRHFSLTPLGVKQVEGTRGGEGQRDFTSDASRYPLVQRSQHACLIHLCTVCRAPIGAKPMAE